MKKTILNLMIAGALMPCNYGMAQVTAYSFAQFTGSYGSPSTGTIIGTLTQDDDVNMATLPFGFTFNGTNYTSVNVCTNGYLSFSALSGIEYSAISDVQTTQLIAPFAQDLFMGTVITGDLTQGSNTITNVSFINNLNIGDSIIDFLGNFGNVNPIITGISVNAIVVNINAQNTVQGADIFINNGSIRQSLTGASPNRVVEFEYKNMTRYAVYNEVINFKVRLYETSNKIEFVYGPMVADFLFTPSEVGLKGAGGFDFNSRAVGSNNTWPTSIASSFITDFCDFSSSSLPNAGLIYAWNPTACIVPVLNVVQSNSTICAGESATLSLSGATTYSWSSGATTESIVVSPANTTSYTAFGFNGSCSASLNVVLQVNQNPTLTVTQTKALICRGNSSTLTASGAGTFTWSNGATGSLVVVSPTLSTTYTVTGFNGSCVDQKTIIQSVSACVGITESSVTTKNLKVFPNPFNEEFTVVNVFEQQAEVKLLNMLGNIVYEGTLEGNEKGVISASTLSSGLYLITLKQGEQQISRKVIKN